MQTHPLRRIFSRFFPRKVSSSIPREAIEANLLPENQKKDLALDYLLRGEMALLQGNLTALSLFEAASNLDSGNPLIWYRQGLAFFEYGSEDGKEKALLLASKYFKIAVQMKPDYFDAWVAWGNVLLQLGRFHEEHHFLLEAKEKYGKALEYAKDQPRETLAELYWDYGIAWSEIAQHSGEALDVRLAIEALQTSIAIKKNLLPNFGTIAEKPIWKWGFSSTIPASTSNRSTTCSAQSPRLPIISTAGCLSRKATPSSTSTPWTSAMWRKPPTRMPNRPKCVLAIPKYGSAGANCSANRAASMTIRNCYG